MGGNLFQNGFISGTSGDSISNYQEKELGAVLDHQAEDDSEDDAYPTVEEYLAMPDLEKLNVLHDSLLELYLNVKIRNFDKTIDSEKVDEELDKLKNVETITLIEYIKSCIEIVMSMKLEESEDKVNEMVKQRMKDLHNKGEYDLSQSPEEYEKIIQKLEAEVRNHISVQQQMKLYIESYQAKVEELEPIEDQFKTMEVELDALKKQNVQYQKELEETREALNDRKQQWETERNQMKKQLIEKEREYDMKIHDLEAKISRTESKHDLKYKHYHKKNEQSVDIPDSQKNMYYSFFDNMKKGNVIISKKNKRGELILLKDDSNKQKHLDNGKKVKYFFHALPTGSVRAKNENEEAFASFTELSTKDLDKPHISNSKKKPTPYGLDCYNYSNDARNNKKIEFKKKPKRINQAHNLSSKKYEYVETAGEEKHKRSKSQTINSIKYRKGNSMQENSMEDMSNLIKNSNSSYQENKVISRSRGKTDKIITFPSRTVAKVMSNVVRTNKANPTTVAALK